MEPLGKNTLLYFGCGGERDLIVVADGAAACAAGAVLGVNFPSERLFPFGEDRRRLR